MSNLIAFNDKNSFALKDQIKKVCEGKARFDMEKKVWMVPSGAMSELNRLSQQFDEKNEKRKTYASFLGSIFSSGFPSLLPCRSYRSGGSSKCWSSGRSAGSPTLAKP